MAHPLRDGRTPAKLRRLGKLAISAGALAFLIGGAVLFLGRSQGHVRLGASAAEVGDERSLASESSRLPG